METLGDLGDIRTPVAIVFVVLDTGGHLHGLPNRNPFIRRPLEGREVLGEWIFDARDRPVLDGGSHQGRYERLANRERDPFGGCIVAQPVALLEDLPVFQDQQSGNLIADHEAVDAGRRQRRGRPRQRKHGGAPRNDPNRRGLVHVAVAGHLLFGPQEQEVFGQAEGVGGGSRSGLRGRVGAAGQPGRRDEEGGSRADHDNDYPRIRLTWVLSDHVVRAQRSSGPRTATVADPLPRATNFPSTSAVSRRNRSPAFRLDNGPAGSSWTWSPRVSCPGGAWSAAR